MHRFKRFQRFIFPLSLNNWPIKVKFLAEKKEKCTGLLPTLISELNQMTSDKIMDGRFGFEVKLSVLWKYLDKKMEILKRMSLLISKLLWNLKFFRKCLSIKNSGIIFQSWKSSSNNLFTQEHCTLVILFLKSTFLYHSFYSHCKEYCV